jgi:hypothetical protein
VGGSLPPSKRAGEIAEPHRTQEGRPDLQNRKESP